MTFTVDKHKEKYKRPVDALQRICRETMGQDEYPLTAKETIKVLFCQHNEIKLTHFLMALGCAETHGLGIQQCGEKYQCVFC